MSDCKRPRNSFLFDLAFWVKAILPLLFIEYEILFFCLEAKFGRDFANAQYVCDNNRRIPLWYPYEMCENYGTIELAYWSGFRNDGVLLEGSRPADVDSTQPVSQLANGILDFQIGKNVVCGTREVRLHNSWEHCEDNPVTGIYYFLFATNMNAVACIENEMEYLRLCSSYGIDGKIRSRFEENFKDFSNRPEVRRTFYNCLHYLFVNPLSREGKDLLLVLMGFPFCVWVVIVWTCWARHVSTYKNKD